MKGSTSLKGIHGVKSMQTINKDAKQTGSNPDFLALYMLEKERKRLHNERTRLQLRLEPIEIRLKEIEVTNAAAIGTKSKFSSDYKQETDEVVEKVIWNTVEISY